MPPGDPTPALNDKAAALLWDLYQNKYIQLLPSQACAVASRNRPEHGLQYHTEVIAVAASWLATHGGLSANGCGSQSERDILDILQQTLRTYAMDLANAYAESGTELETRFHPALFGSLEHFNGGHFVADPDVMMHDTEQHPLTQATGRDGYVAAHGGTSTPAKQPNASPLKRKRP